MDSKTSLDFENLFLALLEEKDQEIKELQARAKTLEQKIIQMSCSNCGKACSETNYEGQENKCGQCSNRLCRYCRMADFLQGGGMQRCFVLEGGGMQRCFVLEGGGMQWCFDCKKAMCPACVCNGYHCQNCKCFTCGLCSPHICNRNEYDPDNL